MRPVSATTSASASIPPVCHDDHGWQALVRFATGDLKPKEEAVDDCQVPTKGPRMTPILDPPRQAIRSTKSAAVNVETCAVSTVHELAEADSTSWLDSNYWPEGIDYDRWGAVVKPSPRSAFADRLDVVDLLDD